MEKISFFISGVMAIQIFLIGAICVHNLFVQYTVLELPWKFKHMLLKSRRSIMSRSALDNLFLFLLLTLFVKGVVMIMPWRF
jgi:hypothetical protein